MTYVKKTKKQKSKERYPQLLSTQFWVALAITCLKNLTIRITVLRITRALFHRIGLIDHISNAQFQHSVSVSFAAGCVGQLGQTPHAKIKFSKYRVFPPLQLSMRVPTPLCLWWFVNRVHSLQPTHKTTHSLTHTHTHTHACTQPLYHIYHVRLLVVLNIPHLVHSPLVKNNIYS